MVIRPQPADGHGGTVWNLSRPASPLAVVKVRLEPTAVPPEQRVHPGQDWLFVEGRALLLLGDRRIEVDAGEAAEFSTMVPHAITVDGPAELLMVFDRDGRGAHLDGASG